MCNNELVMQGLADFVLSDCEGSESLTEEKANEAFVNIGGRLSSYDFDFTALNKNLFREDE